MLNTQLLKIDPVQPEAQVIRTAANIIKNGGLVAFPTETVYGLGADGLNDAAVRRIFAAKGRPADNPLILHIAAIAEIDRLVSYIPANAKALMREFWPGPLSIVLECSSIVPEAVTAGLPTVAVRLPDSQVARELIMAAGTPIAAPSANSSGRPSPTSAQAVLYDMDGKVDMILDGGNCTVGLESTVVDCTTPTPTLLRPGGVTVEMLLAVLGELEYDPNLANQMSAPRSPGMKYTHYAPTSPMILVEAPPDARINILLREVNRALAAGQTVGVVCSVETADLLPKEVVVAVYGQLTQQSQIAARLFECLRKFDDSRVDIIFGEGVDDGGLGLAIMNRFRKAAGYKIIYE